MSEWPTVPLTEVAEIRFSNVDKKTNSGELPVQLCNYMDVYSNGYITADLPFMEASATHAEVERFRVEKGDVMVTKDSETPDDIGIPAVLMDEIPGLICGYHLALIKPNQSKVDSVYLAKQLGSRPIATYFSQLANGSTRYGLSSSAIADAPIPLAPLSQQRRIAEILSTLDDTIEQTDVLIAKYQHIKAGLMRDLFTRGVTFDGHLRPTRVQAPHLYNDSSLGWIPKEWTVMPLDEHVRIIDCKHYTPAFQTEGFPFIRPRNVKVDGLDLQGVDYVSAEDFKTLTDVYQPRYGDIVFSRNASFGVPCYIDTDLQFAIGQDCVIMTAKASDTRFVFCALTNSITTAQIAKVSAGSTFGRINLGEIRKLLIPHPGKEEEQRIAARFFACGDLSRKLIDELAKLRQQKHGLMADLLTGRVRVKVAESKGTLA